MRAPSDDPFIKTVSLRRDWVDSFDEYPYSIPAIRHLHTLELHKNVTFFVGENGTGKSTLLEAIAVTEGFNAEGGSRHAMFKTRDTHHPKLPGKLQLGRPGRKLARSDSYFLRAESFYNLSSYIDDLGGGSHGPVPLSSPMAKRSSLFSPRGSAATASISSTSPKRLFLRSGN